MNRHEYLTKTPVPKLISRLAVPTIISMLVTGIYNTADTFFVGKISTEATAAVGIVFSVMAIIQATGFFYGQGSGSFMSRSLGKGDNAKADEMASTGFAYALISGVIITIAGLFLSEDLAVMIGATPSTLKDTVDYMRIILIGAPFMIGQFVINNQLRFQGSAMYAMAGLLSGAVMNMILDPVLIFVLHMGVRGAAVATVAGQITSFFILLAGSRKGENVRLKLSNIKFSFHMFKEIVNGGLPSLFRQGLAAVSTLLLNVAAGKYGGDAAIAGMSIVTRTIMLMLSALIGFGQGYQPVCSFNYGAGLKKRVREGYFFCLKYGTVFLGIISAICVIFTPQIISWFRDDPEVIAVGTTALRFQASVLVLNGTIITTNMMLQSIGKGVKATITSSAKNGIFFVPLILILPHFFGLTGVEMTQACSDVLAFMVSVPFAYSELKGMK